MKKLTKQEIGIRKLIAWDIARSKARKAQGLTFLDDLSDEGKVKMVEAIQQMHVINAWLGRR